MYKKGVNSWIKHIDFIVLDEFCVVASFIIAYLIRFNLSNIHRSGVNYRQLLVIIMFADLLACIASSNLRNILHRGFAKEFGKVVLLAGISAAITAFVLYSLKIGAAYSRYLIYLVFVVFIFLDFICRLIWKAIELKRLKARNENKDDTKHTVCFIVSDSMNINKSIDIIQDDIFNNYRVIGCAVTDAEHIQDISVNVPIHPIGEAATFICKNWIDEVFIFQPTVSPSLELFISQCKEMGVTLHTILNIEKFDNERQFIESMDDRLMITIAFNSIQLYQAILKRTMDIIGGLVGSVLAVIIGIFIGPIIYFNSPGPILFKQTRVGKNGKTFKMLKFRSMYLDAEQRKAELIKQNRLSSDLMFKIDHDPRIIGNKQLPDGTWKTGIGDFIRRTSLDEFPQFFNVLKGDMSLVGTRPPTLDEWEKYDFHHRARMAIKPGITGLWQVSGRSDITDFEEVVKLDTDYIVNFRLTLDIKILLQTVLVMFKHKGAM